jgi:hypothetical protein
MGSNVWAIERYQKTYLKISWDYPFKYFFFMKNNPPNLLFLTRQTIK